MGLIITDKGHSVGWFKHAKRVQFLNDNSEKEHNSSTSKIEMPVTLVLKIIIYVDNEWACMLTDKGDKLILWQLDM